MAGSSYSYSKTVTTRLKRIGYLIEAENPDLSVTFHPTNIDKTNAAIVSKYDDLYSGYQWTDIQLRDIDVQLTEIYKDYDEARKKHKVSQRSCIWN